MTSGRARPAALFASSGLAFSAKATTACQRIWRTAAIARHIEWQIVTTLWHETGVLQPTDFGRQFFRAVNNHLSATTRHGGSDVQFQRKQR